MRRNNIAGLETDLLKVSHHGSKYDNDRKLYSYILRQKKDSKYAFISADGIKHPDKELFNLIQDYELHPYCTNLSNFCIPDNVHQYIPISNFDEQMRPFLKNYLVGISFPCQDNIHLTISNEGIEVACDREAPCPYRSNFSN